MTRNFTVPDSEEWAETIITYLEANGFPYDRRKQSLYSYLASCASSLTGSNYTIFNQSVPALVIDLAAYFSGLSLTTRNSNFNDALAIVNGLLRASLGVVAPFLPTENLVARYSADQGVTITGSGISQWNDLVGSNHLLQASDAARPTNPTILGRPIVSFLANTFLNIPASLSFNNRAMSVFIVCRNMQAYNPQVSNLPIMTAFAAGASATNCNLYWSTTTAGSVTYRDSAQQVTAINAGTNITLLGAVLGASSATILQGAEQAVVTQGTSNIATGGFINQFTGASPFNAALDVFDIAIYSEAVSPTKLAAIRSYYQRTYGVQNVADTFMSFSGDSQSVAAGLTNTQYLEWPYQMATMAAYQPKFLNFAVASTSTEQMNTAASAGNGADSYLSTEIAYSKKIIVLDGGTNDIQLNSDSAATVFASIQAFRSARLTAGWDEVYHVPIRPRGSAANTAYQATRAAVNNMMLADPTISQWLLTGALSHPIWSATDATNTTWYQGDLIHMTATAAAAQAQLMYAFLKSKGRMS